MNFSLLQSIVMTINCIYSLYSKALCNESYDIWFKNYAFGALFT